MDSLTLDLSGLREGHIRAVTDDVCVTRTGEGVFAFERTCPHAAADLLNGYIEGGQLRCAWHNVPFDLRNGCAPCATMPPIRTFPVTQIDANLYAVDIRGSRA